MNREEIKAEAVAHAPTDIRALLDELEAQDRLIEQLTLTQRQPPHRWHHPYEGSNLQCRDCGLWHGAWSGEGCSAVDPLPLSTWKDRQ